MFKNSLLFALLLTATQQLFAQKKNPNKYSVHKGDFVSAVTKTLTSTNNIENVDLVTSNSSMSTVKTSNPSQTTIKKLHPTVQLDSV